MASGTRRPFNTPPQETGSDISVGKNGPNTTTVIGILGATISPSNPVPGAIYVNDPNLNVINQLTVLPISNIPYKNDTIISYIINAIMFDSDGKIMYFPDGTIVQEY